VSLRTPMSILDHGSDRKKDQMAYATNKEAHSVRLICWIRVFFVFEFVHLQCNAAMLALSPLPHFSQSIGHCTSFFMALNWKDAKEK
jgi:hypothetical protein